MVRVKLHGKEYRLDREHVVNALKGVDPQPTRDFTISLDGKHYPINVDRTVRRIRSP